MHSQSRIISKRPSGIASETFRALASAILLIGLIGDRRAR